MELRSYLNQLPRGGLPGLAVALNVSTVYLQQLAARQGGREASPELCVRIEQATRRAVMRWDLRPSDWHLIWPELTKAKGRPDIPTASTTEGA